MGRGPPRSRSESVTSLKGGGGGSQFPGLRGTSEKRQETCQLEGICGNYGDEKMEQKTGSLTPGRVPICVPAWTYPR